MGYLEKKKSDHLSVSLGTTGLSNRTFLAAFLYVRFSCHINQDGCVLETWNRLLKKFF